MTRPLYHDTKVQRAADPNAASPEARKRGYEERDAPPRTVLWGMASFLGLMVSGLLVSAGVLAWLLHDDSRPRAPFATQPLPAPSPRLLAQPMVERVRIEQAARAGLRDADLPGATRRLLAEGWPDPDAPAPDTATTAREHRERLR